MLIQIMSSGVNSAIQTDVLRNSIHRLASYDRYITGAYLQAGADNDTLGAVTGSLFVGDVSVADLVSANASNPAGGLNLFPVDADIPAGEELRFIINSNTGPLATIVTVQIDPLMEDDGMGDLTY